MPETRRVVFIVSLARWLAGWLRCPSHTLPNAKLKYNQLTFAVLQAGRWTGFEWLVSLAQSTR